MLKSLITFESNIYLPTDKLLVLAKYTKPDAN